MAKTFSRRSNSQKKRHKKSSVKLANKQAPRRSYDSVHSVVLTAALRREIEQLMEIPEVRQAIGNGADNVDAEECFLPLLLLMGLWGGSKAMRGRSGNRGLFGGRGLGGFGGFSRPGAGGFGGGFGGFANRFGVFGNNGGFGGNYGQPDGYYGNGDGPGGAGGFWGSGAGRLGGGFGGSGGMGGGLFGRGFPFIF